MIKVNQNGNLKIVDNLKINHNGALRTISKGFVNDNGVLREIYQGGTLHVNDFANPNSTDTILGDDREESIIIYANRDVEWSYPTLTDIVVLNETKRQLSLDFQGSDGDSESFTLNVNDGKRIITVTLGIEEQQPDDDR